MAAIVGENSAVLPSGGSSVSGIFTVDFTATFGAIAALVGTVQTATITGLLTTDAVSVNCLGTMTAGANISNARVSTSDVLEITFTTAVALGVSLGALTYRAVVFRK